MIFHSLIKKKITKSCLNPQQLPWLNPEQKKKGCALHSPCPLIMTSPNGQQFLSHAKFLLQ
jgi:hypothetical protein